MSEQTIEDLRNHFLQAIIANGGDMNSSVDALTEPGAVTLKKASNNAYPESGQLSP
jgi:hypothetical protein